MLSISSKPLSQLMLLLIMSIALLFGNSSCKNDDDPVTSSYILIYNGVSADSYCVSNMEKGFKELGYEVQFISDLSKLPAMLPNAKAFVIGGTDDDTQKILDPLYKVENDLKNYISNGGRYMGICGGAYIASKGSQWDDGYEDGISLVDVESVEFDKDYHDAQIINVQWLRAQRNVYLLGGPAFNGSDIPDATILAKYNDNRVAAFLLNSGNGRILLCGPHPEADSTWLEGENVKNAGNWMNSWDLFLDMTKKLMAV